MTEHSHKFGDRVRQARKEKEIGLREFARVVNMDYSNLSRIERGKRPPPDLDLVIKIAEKLDIDHTELLRLAGVPDKVIENQQDEETRNWIHGSVIGKSGNLTEIDAGGCPLYLAEEPSTDEVLLGLRPEDITLYLTNDGFSDISALNRIQGRVEAIESCDNYNLVNLDCSCFNLDVAITDTSLEKMNLMPGKAVYATFKATAPAVREQPSNE